MSKEQEANTSESRGGRLKNFIKENWQTLVVALIVLIIGNSAYNNSKKESSLTNPNQTENSPTQNQTSESKEEEIKPSEQNSNSQNVDNQNQNNNPQPAVDPSKSSEPKPADIKNNAKEYAEAARRGEGRTHLARRAMQRYLTDQADKNVTAEQQIYIEDFLQKQTGRGGLHIGQQLSFSTEQIQAAIERAKQLSPAALRNLKKYVR